MEGWISLYRQIVDNWIWNINEPFDKRSAWIDLLLMVNHKTEKIQFNGKIVEVERGQKITSLEKLAARWKWSRHKVSDFLFRLEQDGMLVQIRDKKKTLISIENYSKFQSIEKNPTCPRTCSRNGKGHVWDTNNNDNNINIICPSEDGLEEKLLKDFEIIWNIYPRKEGKSIAYKHYKSWLKGKKYIGKKQKITNKEMWYAVKIYKLEIKEQKKKGFIKMGSTFFNEAIFEYANKYKENPEHWEKKLEEYDE